MWDLYRSLQMNDWLRDSAATVQPWKLLRTYKNLHTNFQPTPKEMFDRVTTAKTTLRKAEPKAAFSHRKPEVGRVVQFREHSLLLGEVYVHTV